MKYQAALPWIVAAFGLRKKVSDFLGRVIHVPNEAVDSAAAIAGVTVAQWRRVEAVQQQIVDKGILVRTTGESVAG